MTIHSLRMCTATAMQPSTVSRVSRAAIVRILQKEPAFAKLVISYLSFRVARFLPGELLHEQILIDDNGTLQVHKSLHTLLLDT